MWCRYLEAKESIKTIEEAYTASIQVRLQCSPIYKLVQNSHLILAVTSEGGPKDKMVLSNVSGRCDWGKLTFIMGQKDSGKAWMLRNIKFYNFSVFRSIGRSTLLHLLGDGAASADGTITGSIKHNGRLLTHRSAQTFSLTTQPQWKRCGYVCTTDEHFSTLTVST